MKIARPILLIGLASFVVALSPSCKKSSAPIDPNAAIEIPELKIKVGQTVRTIMETVTEDGTMKIVGGKQNGTGQMFVQRVRIFETTRTATGFQYDIQKNDSAASFQWDDQEYPTETHTSLTGRPVVSSRDANSGEWKLELKEGNASPEQKEEIQAFQSYANRNWLPDHPVKVGDTWPCKPGFIQHFIQSDLIKTDSTGSLKLLSIEDNNAIMSVNIQGKGQSIDGKGSVSKATINLIGTAVFSIQTGLDLGLDLKGTVTSGVQHSTGEVKAVLLPVVIKVRKKILE